MPLYAAVWTMNPAAAGGASSAARVDEFQNVALTADTQLKLAGRATGAAFRHMLIVPEYFYNAGGALLSRSNKHAIYERLQNISARVPQMYIVAGTVAYKKGTFSTDTYNVCPVLHNGAILKKLYKRDDDGAYQINGTFRTKTDGGKGVPVVNLGGLMLGLDICMDYNRGRLADYLAANALPHPDIHVHISGTNANQPGRNQARINGVYVHCDQGSKGANGAKAFLVQGRDAIGNAAVANIAPTAVDNRGAGSQVVYFTLPV